MLADDTQNHVTIRGSGTNVTLEPTRSPRRRKSAAVAPPGSLADAVALKAQGLDDATLIAYLSAHQAELPTVVARSRNSSAPLGRGGQSVVAYLAHRRRRGHRPDRPNRPSAAAPPPETVLANAGYGESPYDSAYGYPSWGSYGASPGRVPGRPVLRRMVFPRGQSLVPRGPSPRPDRAGRCSSPEEDRVVGLRVALRLHGR